MNNDRELAHVIAFVCFNADVAKCNPVCATGATSDRLAAHGEVAGTRQDIADSYFNVEITIRNIFASSRVLRRFLISTLKSKSANISAASEGVAVHGEVAGARQAGREVRPVLAVLARDGLARLRLRLRLRLLSLSLSPRLG